MMKSRVTRTIADFFNRRTPAWVGLLSPSGPVPESLQIMLWFENPHQISFPHWLLVARQVGSLWPERIGCFLMLDAGWF
jgi:hypothetical protein